MQNLSKYEYLYSSRMTYAVLSDIWHAVNIGIYNILYISCWCSEKKWDTEPPQQQQKSGTVSAVISYDLLLIPQKLDDVKYSVWLTTLPSPPLHHIFDGTTDDTYTHTYRLHSIFTTNCKLIYFNWISFVNSPIYPSSSLHPPQPETEFKLPSFSTQSNLIELCNLIF